LQEEGKMAIKINLNIEGEGEMFIVDSWHKLKKGDIIAVGKNELH
jgi:quercetin dioxygenase-like cupin family protein